mgnify:CR=1 FL=1
MPSYSLEARARIIGKIKVQCSQYILLFGEVLVLAQESNTIIIPTDPSSQAIRHPKKCKLTHLCTSSVTEVKILLLFESFFCCMFPFLNLLFVQMYIHELIILSAQCISPYYCFPENLYSHSSIFLLVIFCLAFIWCAYSMGYYRLIFFICSCTNAYSLLSQI